MNEQEKNMLKAAIDSHIHLLYRESEGYKRSNNIEAIKDCMSEVRKYKELKEKLL